MKTSGDAQDKDVNLAREKRRMANVSQVRGSGKVAQPFR
jgi:hypothetical protein